MKMRKKVSLGELCNPSLGQVKEQPDTLIDYIDISSVDNESKSITGFQTMLFSEAPSRARKDIKKNNILVSTVRPNLNAVAVYEEETPNKTVVSTGFCVLDCKDNVDYRFVFNFCKSQAFIDDMVSQATGASYPAVSDKIVRSSMIPSYSHEEQCQISRILDIVSKIIVDRKKKLQKLDDLIKARFIEMFGDPVADSMNWGQLPLSHYLKSIRYGTSTPPSFSETGYEFIRATNIKNGKIINRDMKYISEEEAQKIEKCKVFGGEMLIVRSGVNAGDTCIITDVHCGQYAGYDMILVFTEDLHPVFVNVLLNTEYMDSVVKPLTRRAAQPHLNSEQVQSLPIIQVPYTQQEKFVAFVEQIDKSKVAVQKALDETQKLFDSLMQQYFG